MLEYWRREGDLPPGRVASTLVFETDPFSRSDIFPFCYCHHAGLFGMLTDLTFPFCSNDEFAKR